MRKHHQRIFDGVLLTMLCGMITLSRWHTFAEPADWDIATYSVIGHELSLGQSLYSDIWDVKPPAVAVSYMLAEKLTGYGLAEVYLLAVVTACATMLGIWIIARQLDPLAGSVAAALYTIVSGDLYLQGNRANAEAFMNAWTVFAIVFLVWPMPKHRIIRMFLVGGCFTMATMYKQVAIAPAIAVMAGLIIKPSPGTSRKNCLIDAAIVLSLIASAWLGLFAYFALTSRGELFWMTAIVYPRFYGGSFSGNLLTSLQPAHLWPSFMFAVLPSALLTLVALIWLRGKEFVLLVAMLIGAWISVATLKQFYNHYYQLLLPVTSIGAGWGAVMLMKHLKNRTIAIAAIGSVIVGAAWIQLPRYSLSANDWCSEKSSSFYVMEQSVGRELAKVLPPGETFFDWSENNPWLYFVSRRRPIGPGLWRAHMTEGPMKDYLTDRTLERLKAHPPAMVVWSETEYADHPINQWIQQNYEPVQDGVFRVSLTLMKKQP